MLLIAWQNLFIILLWGENESAKNEIFLSCHRFTRHQQKAEGFGGFERVNHIGDIASACSGIVLVCKTEGVKIRCCGEEESQLAEDWVSEDFSELRQARRYEACPWGFPEKRSKEATV